MRAKKGRILEKGNVFDIAVDDSEPGRNSHLKKDTGARRKFRKEPLRDSKILFYGRGLNISFTPNRY